MNNKIEGVGQSPALSYFWAKIISMKKLQLFFIAAGILLTVNASDLFAQGQGQKMKSPAATATGKIDGVNITINYSQPAVRGRKIMGELVPYGKVWRTGANATTSIEFSDAVKIDGKTVAKGKYGLYTIPGKDEWTIMLNKDIKWGSDEYTEKQDVVRVKSKPAKTAALVESFTISVENNLVVMRWENTEVSFKVSK